MSVSSKYILPGEVEKQEGARSVVTFLIYLAIISYFFCGVFLR